ncbi:MAG: cob(II)yrinic acid a,c-diamide reductase [Ilumatobacteraceae bacterium]|nr:cob(II)yrinic acid a,c-diamide reductase [Ilumatobacteraceae bacterium]
MTTLRSDLPTADLDARTSSWARPVPLIGDATSAAERAEDPRGWAFDGEAQAALAAVIGARRDIRRYRADPVPALDLDAVLLAGHSAPSVGHSQPWRFIVVTGTATRDAAAALADRARHRQAAQMDDASGRHLLDLQLDGVREAPIGIIVCCDRRTDPVGVLGRATFHDADVWSCACAIQNMWLTARARGLGMGWVTLFEPDDLAVLVGLPDGVMTLGWMCIGYPDERPPAPGLSRAGWSERLPIGDVVFHERWPDLPTPPPTARVRGLEPEQLVTTRDDTDAILSPPGSLGRLDQVVDRVVAWRGADVDRATLVLIGADHPVADLGVTAFQRSVTAEVLAAAGAGVSLGVAAARTAGFDTVVVDAGSSTGDLVHADAMTIEHTTRLVAEGRLLGAHLARQGLVLLGEVGIGNTTVAAALACALTGASPADMVGLGAGADSTMLARKREVVADALARVAGGPNGWVDVLAALGGPEIAQLVGVVLGAAAAGGVVVLDGMVTTVAALLACASEPSAAAHLVAGQRSREAGHQRLLDELGLSPLLDLRLRAGEGVGAVMAARLVLGAVQTRRTVARVTR